MTQLLLVQISALEVTTSQSPAFLLKSYWNGQNAKVTKAFVKSLTPPPLSPSLWLSEQTHQCIIPASSFDLFTLMPRWLRYNSTQFSKQPNWGYRWVGRIWNHNPSTTTNTDKNINTDTNSYTFFLTERNLKKKNGNLKWFKVKAATVMLVFQELANDDKRTNPRGICQTLQNFVK